MTEDTLDALAFINPMLPRLAQLALAIRAEDVDAALILYEGGLFIWGDAWVAFAAKSKVPNLSEMAGME